MEVAPLDSAILIALIALSQGVIAVRHRIKAGAWPSKHERSRSLIYTFFLMGLAFVGFLVLMIAARLLSGQPLVPDFAASGSRP